MRRGIDALERAGVEFGQSAKLSHATADEWGRAREALAGSRLDGIEQAALDRSDEARSMARTMDGYAEHSRASAGKMSRAAGRWVKHTSEWKDGDRLAGCRNAWLAGRGEMQAVADGGRARAAKMAKGTLATVRMAEDELARLAAGAKGFAAEAFGMLSGLDAPDAVAALREGMEAASRAALDGGRALRQEAGTASPARPAAAAGRFPAGRRG